MNASLRTATIEDIQAVAHVLIWSRMVFLPFAPSVHPPAVLRQWVAEHLIPSGRVTVAVVEDQVVAVLAVSEADGHSWIDQLYVLPGFEGRGLGTRLLHHAHTILRPPIRLCTFQANTRARHFYERHGYVAIRFTDGHGNEEGCPDVVYERLDMRPGT
jgi:ribosomal protein S18 acetylase RimI-like enzyme